MLGVLPHFAGDRVMHGDLGVGRILQRCCKAQRSLKRVEIGNSD